MLSNDDLVVLYVVEKDDDELLKQQELRLRKYCELNHYEVQEVYKDTNCEFNMNRPQLQKLLREIEQGNIKKVIACSMDTISRNIDDLMIFVKPFFANECCFETLDRFDMFSYLGKTKTSLFTIFTDEIEGGMS